MVEQTFLNELRKEGFRITPQRVAIIDYILESKSRPTAEDIHQDIQKTYPMTSLSTVYKTIELLKAKNVIRPTGVSEKTRFEISKNDQINLICNNCGNIETISDSSLTEIESKAKRKTQFQIENSRIEFLGLCKRCKTKS